MPDDTTSAEVGTTSAGIVAGGAPEAWTELAALAPDWGSIPGVRAFTTGRAGGVSQGPWGLDGERPGGLNLGSRCGDDPSAVRRNRARLRSVLPAMPVWLRQVHGAEVHVATGAALELEPQADAAITDRAGVVLAVLTGDCLPVFLADAQGRAVGVAHAGWRGLAAGVLERSVEAIRRLLPPQADLRAWLGPAIGPEAFEVGDEVFDAFCREDPAARPAFGAGVVAGKWQADLYQLARLRLARAGVADISGGGACTYTDSARFWSYRRRRDSGRMASVIWIARRGEPADDEAGNEASNE